MNQAVVKEKPAAHEKPPSKTIKIILDDQANGDIPGGLGQFIGHNDRYWHLKPGMVAEVPEEVLDVLDNAVKMVPVIDPVTKRVTTWRRTKRFPYTVVRD